MKGTFIIHCERCKKQFVYGVAIDTKPVPQSCSGKHWISFKNKEVVYHQYVSGLELKIYHEKSYGLVELNCTEPILLCEECDVAYWANFEKANFMLSEFWKEEE